MKQACLVEPFALVMEEVERLPCGDDEVLLKVHTVGICGSDIQMYHGLHKYMRYPVVIGHEVGAEVVEAGSSVEGFAPGDRVTVEPQVTCGSCYACGIGRFNVCEQLSVMGVHQDGFMREYVAIPSQYLHKCPRDMDWTLAALVEPAAVGIGAVRRAGDIKGANVLVVGAGPIGNLTAQAAMAFGAGKVLIADVVEPKLQAARQAGIGACENTGETPLDKAITRHFGARRADVIIDCAASPAAFAQMLQAARTSSKIVVTGNYKQPVTLEMPLVQRREVDVLGHMMYVREEFADAIALLAAGTIRTGPLLSTRFPLAELDAAFAYIDDHADEVMKVMVDVAANNASTP